MSDFPGDPNLPGGCTNKMLDAHMGGPDYGTKECPDCEGGMVVEDEDGEDGQFITCPTCQGEGVVDKTAEDIAEDRASALEAQWDARNDR